MTFVLFHFLRGKVKLISTGMPLYEAFGTWSSNMTIAKFMYAESFYHLIIRIIIDTVEHSSCVSFLGQPQWNI